MGEMGELFLVFSSFNKLNTIFKIAINPFKERMHQRKGAGLQWKQS